MTNVTVIGLGSMGHALAARFIAEGHDVTVWNRSRGKAEALAAGGAKVAATPAEAARASDLIVICVVDYHAVSEVMEAIGSDISGRTLVNLTNGTPRQARVTATSLAAQGARYVDGGIMAVPPMIGTPEALILYSGDKAAFEASASTLQALAAVRYVGEDAGLASTYDLALLAGMYGVFAGGLQAIAMIEAEGIKAVEFLPLLNDWMVAMTVSQLPLMAENVDSGVHDRDVVSNIGMQLAAFDNILNAGRDQGVSVDLIAPLAEAMRKRVEAGHPADDTSGMFEIIKAGRS